MFEQPGAIAQRFSDQLDVESFEVAQAAVDHFRCGGRRLRAAAAALENCYLVALPDQLPRHPRPVDAASDNRDSHRQIVPCITRK